VVAVLGVVLLVIVFGGIGWFLWWSRRAADGHRIETTLSHDRARELFASKVAGFAWRISDDGNPTVAQGPWWEGRAQISMWFHGTQGSSAARIEIQPTRIAHRGGGGPFMSGRAPKVVTLWLRMQRFTRAVQAADPNARMTEMTNR
jgi:hypothetical protein